MKLRDWYVHILRIEKMSKYIRIYHFQNIFVAAWTERYSILYKCFQCSFNRLEKWVFNPLASPYMDLQGG